MEAEDVLYLLAIDGYTLERNEEEGGFILVRELDGKPVAKVWLEIEPLEDQYEAVA
ncbi:MAG: hypothetical protein ACTSSA_15410 [Candidatus Freyarchaeota archaeon]